MYTCIITYLGRGMHSAVVIELNWPHICIVDVEGHKSVVSL